MSYVDAVITMKTLLDTITIPPEAGGAAIPKVVQVGWLPQSVEKNSTGQMKPYYTIIRSTLPVTPLDNKGDAETYNDNLQIDCWCVAYGTEKANLLMEKMLIQLRAIIKTNKLYPNSSAFFLHIISETPKDEPNENPPIKRTMVLVEVKGMR